MCVNLCLGDPYLRIYGCLERHISKIFLGLVPLSTNLRPYFRTGVWIHFLVTPIYESRGISIDTYARFFCFGTAIYESTPLFSYRCVNLSLGDPYLRIYGCLE